MGIATLDGAGICDPMFGDFDKKKTGSATVLSRSKIFLGKLFVGAF